MILIMFFRPKVTFYTSVPRNVTIGREVFLFLEYFFVCLYKTDNICINMHLWFLLLPYIGITSLSTTLVYFWESLT